MNECKANTKMIYIEVVMTILMLLLITGLCMNLMLPNYEQHKEGCLFVLFVMTILDVILLYHVIHTFLRRTDTVQFYPSYFVYRNHNYSMEDHTYHVLQHRLHFLGLIPTGIYVSELRNEQGKFCVSSKYIEDISYAFHQYYGGKNKHEQRNYNWDSSDRFDYDLRFGEGTHQQEKRF